MLHQLSDLSAIGQCAAKLLMIYQDFPQRDISAINVFGQICTAHAQNLLFLRFRGGVLSSSLDSASQISWNRSVIWRSDDTSMCFYSTDRTSVIFLFPVCLT